MPIVAIADDQPQYQADANDPISSSLIQHSFQNHVKFRRSLKIGPVCQKHDHCRNPVGHAIVIMVGSQFRQVRPSIGVRTILQHLPDES